MTKLRERFVAEDGKLHHLRTFDIEPTLKRAKAARDGIGARWGQAERQASIPGWLISQWLREEGIEYHDAEGRMACIRRRLMSGDYNALLATDRQINRTPDVRKKRQQSNLILSARDLTNKTPASG